VAKSSSARLYDERAYEDLGRGVIDLSADKVFLIGVCRFMAACEYAVP
jgi:hypothetical protein